ncbi:MAG: ABC-ATPase domain-containing protein [Lachnospiraceae bacterium]|nr:ABC-ATPase domain-containing protein [Lachnospiraceae bacterium]
MTHNDLRETLHRIDHKGYPAYKDTRGRYEFTDYVLSIDHVQGDPFAAPSKLSVWVNGSKAKFDKSLYDTEEKRIALQDHLLRNMARQVRDYSFKAKGSGKSGLISVTNPGQEILERTACQIDATTGEVVLRLEVGFPANGRTINSRELEKILFDFLPVCVKKTLFASAYKPESLKAVADLAVDQRYIRDRLSDMGLVAFVANGAVLPRKSGVSMLPMKEGVAFTSPRSMEVTIELPNKGSITGMGIPKGITLIVGGGYHGKSTLLKALELGVYNHIAGDGREYVITDESAVKLRAEDGRSIQKTDISMFIRNLPNKKNTKEFYTEDASGSTSQAANTVEAIEAGANVFLMDEDTSATNFMIRDELMQKVVTRDMEPIIPFIDRVEELYSEYGISTILVAGSSGSYFYKADHIIQMKEYVPIEITEMAKKEAEDYRTEPYVETDGTAADYKSSKPSFNRIVRHDVPFAKNDRIKMKTMGTESISINKDMVDLRYMEQLTDPEQLNAIAQMIKHLKLNAWNGRLTVGDAVEQLYRRIEEKGFAAFIKGDLPGNLALPRKQELYGAINRCRGLIKID